MAASGDTTTVPLWGFVAGSSLLISMYGGLLGILPAFVSDTFGSKNATSIFGRWVCMPWVLLCRGLCIESMWYCEYDLR